jgi:carboxymethylenebutenolidase
MQRVWGEHLAAEFGTRDVEATLQTMVDDPFIHNVPVATGGQGRAGVSGFYEEFIASWPDEVHIEPLNRVLGADQLVDELRVTFNHTKPMEWLLPGVTPTDRRIDMDVVVVVSFRDGRVAGERVYWDHAAVLRQVGLLPTAETVTTQTVNEGGAMSVTVFYDSRRPLAGPRSWWRYSWPGETSASPSPAARPSMSIRVSAIPTV